MAETPADTVPESTVPPVPSTPVPDASPPIDPTLPNYHVSLWDAGGPAYVCLLCPLDPPHLPLDAMEQHVRDVHQVEPLPTSMIAPLLAFRAQYEVRAAEQAAETAETPTTTETTPSLPEETPDGGGNPATDAHVQG